MEGTRHERAALVGVAYFLGFLTTFIGFGQSATSTEALPLETVTSQPAAVVAAVAVESAPADEVATEAEPGVVSYENGILEVSALGGTRTLSVNSEVSGLEASADFAEQGIHVGQIAYSASPTGEYVFFCEQKAAEAQTCSPFVYDVLTDKIYRVTKDGDKVDLINSAAKSVTWNNGSLTIGSASSKEAAKPWMLGN